METEQLGDDSEKEMPPPFSEKGELRVSGRYLDYIIHKNWILLERSSQFIITNQLKNMEQQNNWIENPKKKRKLNSEENLNLDEVFKQQQKFWNGSVWWNEEQKKKKKRFMVELFKEMEAVEEETEIRIGSWNQDYDRWDGEILIVPDIFLF